MTLITGVLDSIGSHAARALLNLDKFVALTAHHFTHDHHD